MGFGVRVSGVQTPVLERGLNESSIFLKGRGLLTTSGLHSGSASVRLMSLQGSSRVLIVF